jgi:hypothetical protein
MADTLPNDVSLTAPTGMGGSGLPQIQTPAPQVNQAPPVDPNTAHDQFFGRAAKMLLGNNTTYSVDANGNMQSSSTPNKPGQFFRNVLAAAILGGAAGAEGNPAQGATGGFVRGGAAEIQDQRQQDLLKQQQAQRDLQNRQSVSKEQREQQAFATEEEVRKAQIAQSNAQTLHLNMLMQGESLNQHEKLAEMGKTHFADYTASDLQPVFKDIPETEMNDVLKNRPGAGALDWAATGVKPVLGPDGKPSYETTYSAYDPKGQITVSQKTIDQWKKDGLDKYRPELFGVVKAGKPMDATAYIALKQMDEKLFADNVGRETKTLDVKKIQAEIDNFNAQRQAHLATAAHEYAETNKTKEAAQAEKTAQQALSNALEELNKNGGDFSKISSKAKVIIGESAAKLVPSMEAEVHAILTNDPTDSEGLAKSLMKQMDSIRTLSLGAIQSTPAPSKAATTTYVLPDGSQYAIPEDQKDKFLKANPKAQPLGAGNDNEKVSVKLGNGQLQNMTRAEFKANQQKFASLPSINPQAAAWKDATIVGPAVETPAASGSTINPQNLM